MKSIVLTQRRADWLLAVLAMIWGSSYLWMKISLTGVPPFFLIFLRFGIAFVLVAGLCHSRLRQTTKRLLKGSALLGLLLFAVFACLLQGMETTNASTAGFLVSTTVVFVPLLQALLQQQRPSRTLMGCCFLTLTGIAMLTLQEQLSWNTGALLCIASAVCYALQILETDREIRLTNALLLGIWQLAFAAGYGLLASLCFETPAFPATGLQWGSVLGLAVLCSAFGFVLQPVAQAHTTPTHTGLIFSLEPVFSALFAFLFLQEWLSLQGWLGAALVLTSVLLAARRAA
ncbi:MAG: DMT family transporter [Megasphaera sp.]|uniref:DMT family transporter n=1 Tax=Megasphaera sp. TaxID=2023260 RepID=UPI003F095B9C